MKKGPTDDDTIGLHAENQGTLGHREEILSTVWIAQIKSAVISDVTTRGAGGSSPLLPRWCSRFP